MVLRNSLQLPRPSPQHPPTSWRQQKEQHHQQKQQQRQQNQHDQDRNQRHQRRKSDSIVVRQSATSSSSSCIASSVIRHPSPRPRSLRVADRGASKVRCPHCLRGFSPSVAPTHIAICAKVENRPRGNAAAASSGGSGAAAGVLSKKAIAVVRLGHSRHANQIFTD